MFLEWKQCRECGSLVPAIMKCAQLPDCGFAYRYVRVLDVGTRRAHRRAPVNVEAEKPEGDTRIQVSGLID